MFRIVFPCPLCPPWWRALEWQGAAVLRYPFHMPAIVNVNGRVSDQKDAVISVFDHGFLYGEGVYETLRTYNGEPFLFDRHMRRLRTSAGMLALAVPLSDSDIDRRFRETVHAAGLGGDASREAYIRILVTRGVGELSYDPAGCPEPTVVVIVKPHVNPPAEVFAKGVRVSLVPTVRNHPGSVSPLIKSNNLLNNALAMQEALRRGSFEGIMRNHKGELAECTQSNLFIVKSGAALTPPIAAGLLPGITRAYLFEIGSELGVPVREQVLRDEDLFGADECFLTSTTREVLPIVQVDDAKIGSGVPGPVTRALLDGFRRRAEGLTRLSLRAEEP
jgi:branched-chain amino acid aminotransferase